VRMLRNGCIPEGRRCGREAVSTMSECGPCARADAVADEVGERTVKLGGRWNGRFPRSQPK
jgi:hypothetical protein